MRLNSEVKVLCAHPEKLRKLLKDKKARFHGVDRQTDTYFRVPQGRLKLREGNIENSLIQYHRPNEAGPRTSWFQLIPVEPGSGLKEILTTALGVLVVVVKEREIYYFDNIKFHIDQVKGLGTFAEIEARGTLGEDTEAALEAQCKELCQEFGFAAQDFLSGSYSDLLLANPAPSQDSGAVL